MNDSFSEKPPVIDLEHLSRRTGLIVRSIDAHSLTILFNRLAEYDPNDRAEKVSYTKRLITIKEAAQIGVRRGNFKMDNTTKEKSYLLLVLSAGWAPTSQRLRWPPATRLSRPGRNPDTVNNHS